MNKKNAFLGLLTVIASVSFVSSASAATSAKSYITSEPTYVKAKQKIAVGYTGKNGKKKVYVKKGTVLRVIPSENVKGIPTFSFDANTLSSKQLNKKKINATTIVTAKKKYFSIVKPKTNSINGWQFRNTGATVTLSDFEESLQTPTFSITTDGKSLKYNDYGEMSEHKITKMTKKGSKYTVIYERKLPGFKNKKNSKNKGTYKLTIQNKFKKAYPFKNISAVHLAQIQDAGYSISNEDKKVVIYQYKINDKTLFSRRGLPQYGQFV
ncbi:hypothetical protein EQG49_00135 [Periweissella cryptocerci]|uniref:Surface layer protein A domain-containing protein n=1 Tax=Periweissella cryptocerci TaxID=2506420 RepID=A0A4P6YQU7_9LACO|nr:hypothetical protein [Periweissella cryptocerci]QBO34962.1 hypothetical protein EQG49_00135 [Periweissella cryptocerci]